MYVYDLTCRFKILVVILNTMYRFIYLCFIKLMVHKYTYMNFDKVKVIKMTHSLLIRVYYLIFAGLWMFV